MKKYLCGVICLLIMITFMTSCENGSDEELSPNITESQLTEMSQDTSAASEVSHRTYKTVSFFGDSITTYDGYSNDASRNGSTKGNRCWQYSEGNVPIDKTWWHKAMSDLSLELCVNNAYSGDKVSSDICLSRAENLHTDAGVYPDIIVIYIGINDYNGTGSADEFKQNYDALLNTVRNNYKASEIFCCTLLPCHTTTEQRITRLEQFNSAISSACDKYSAHTIDLYGAFGSKWIDKLSLYTVDNLHPNTFGMELMAEKVTQDIKAFTED